MNRMLPSYMPMQDLTRQQDVSGLPPMYQNIANQQAMQQAALQQGMGLTNQAGMTVDGKQAGAGMNPMAMAMMLRQQPSQQQINARDVQMGGMGTYNPFSQYNVSQQYGTNPYSQQSRMLAAQEF
jgi:hypothetical protein